MKKRRFDNENKNIMCHDGNYEESYIFPNIQELLQYIESFDTTDCLFRGQSGLWEVTSSLHRHCSSMEGLQKASAITNKAVKWLKSNKYINSMLKDNDDYALAVAQHYGCPTDLIDLTKNCRTAAYFASSDNNRHIETPVGCIWVFTKKDLKKFQDILRSDQFGCFSSLPQCMQEKLAQSDFNQLIELEIPQLSRLNAQEGLFLWDVCGLVNKQLRLRNIGTLFKFTHVGDEKQLFAEYEERLFPFPNQLESEVMRFFTEKHRTSEGLPEYYAFAESSENRKEVELLEKLSGELTDKNSKKSATTYPDFFSPSFGDYPWEYGYITQSNYYFKHIDKREYMEFHLPLNEKGILPIVQHIITNIIENSLTDLLIIIYRGDKKYVIQDGDEEVLINLVVNLNNYGYPNEDIAKVILEWLRMQIFIGENGYPKRNDDQFEIALVLGRVNDWIAEYYGCETTKLTLNEGKLSSRFWLPADYMFLEEEYINEFSSIEKNSYNIPQIFKKYYETIPDNAKIFFYQHKPQKIMSYAAMRKMFVELILPQQLIFRPFKEGIYIPDYVNALSLPIFGQELLFFDRLPKSDEMYGEFLVL